MTTTSSRVNNKKIDDEKYIDKIKCGKTIDIRVENIKDGNGMNIAIGTNIAIGNVGNHINNIEIGHINNKQLHTRLAGTLHAVPPGVAHTSGNNIKVTLKQQHYNIEPLLHRLPLLDHLREDIR